MAALSVKVPRTKLIEALQVSLDKETDLPKRDGIDAQQTAFKAAQDAWGKKAIKEIAKNVNVTQVRNYYGSTQITFDVSGLGLDALPVYADFATTVVRYQDDTKIAELENAIKILGLSEEEFVNASTYKTVVQYI